MIANACSLSNLYLEAEPQEDVLVEENRVPKGMPGTLHKHSKSKT